MPGKLRVRALQLRRKCRLAEGLCPYCPQTSRRKIVPGKARCKKCLAYYAEANRKLIARRKQQGVCVHCGTEPCYQGKIRCRACLLEDSHRLAKRRREKQQQLQQNQEHGNGKSK